MAQRLQNSLADLEKLGVDAVSVGMTSGSFVIAEGVVDFANPLPTVNAATGVQVSLEVSNTAFNGINPTQLAADATALHNAGFDAIMAVGGNLTLDSTQVDAIHSGGLVFNQPDVVTMQVASGTEGVVLSDLVASIDGPAPTYHHDLDIIDLVDNSMSITDAQATSLISEGLTFAANDAVDVTFTAGQALGTHLQTSLQGLQSLGVDVVTIAMTSGAIGIAEGTGGIDFAHLPTVVADAGVVVGLEVIDTAFSDINAANATALHAAGFDAIMAADGDLTLDSTQVDAIHSGSLVFDQPDTITMQVSSVNEDVVLTNLVSAIDGQTYQHDLDVIDLVDNGISITDAQASSLVHAGLQFAADDTGVAVHAVGTHLNTSLSDLQHLGVDVVHTTQGHVDTVVLDLGSGGLTSHTLPVFDTEDHVQLNVLDNQLGSMLEWVNSVDRNSPNIDTLSVALHDSLGVGAELQGAGVLDPAFHNAGLTIELNASFADSAVTLGMILEAADGVADPLMALHGQTLVDAMQAAGISNINIDQITHFTVADTDLKALMDHGLITADHAADVTVTNTGGLLDASLAQLVAIGADHVQILNGGTTLTVNADVPLYGTGAELQGVLNQMLKAFEDPTGVVKSVFDQTNTVDLKVAAPSGFHLDDANLLHNLQLLGIDDVLDANGHSIKPVA